LDIINPVSSAIAFKLVNISKCSIKILAANAKASSGEIEPLVHTSNISLSKLLF